MLLRFRFSNFRSFRDEQELSLIASDAGGGFEVPGLKESALPACAIYGANASGKSNVLKALAFVRQAVLESHRLWEPDGPIPVQTFRGDAEPRPAEFSLDFVADGVRYEFGFETSATEVTEEWLHSFPNGKKQLLYERSGPAAIRFGRELHGHNKRIAALMRKNSLFISVAVQNNHGPLRPVYSWIETSLDVFEKTIHSPLTSAIMCKTSEDWRARLSQLIQLGDFGVADIVKNRNSGSAQPDPAELLGAIQSAVVQPNAGAHLAQALVPQVKMLHQLGNDLVPFELGDESNGTLVWFSLVGPALRAVDTGRVLIVDELDSSLHPALAAFLVSLFTNKATNPKSAQLIFNTHDTNLLANGVLRRDQVWFTEKDRQGMSHLYPLTDFKPRPDENFQKRYLQGRFGAIPFIRSEKLSAA